MTLQEITAGRDSRDLPQLVPEAVNLLWHDDFWDGPLSGLLEYRGERLWFQLAEEADDPVAGWYRRYLVVRLTPEQLREEEKWHGLFRRCVGTHTDYRSDERQPGAVHPREQWSEFYDAYAKRNPRSLDENEVVGWFGR